MTSSTGKHERGTCFPSLSDIFLGNRKQRVGTDVTAHDTSLATVHVSKRSINTYGMKLRNSFERAQDERDAEVNEWHLPEAWCLDFQMTPPVG